MSERTREPQYQNCLEIRDRQGLAPLGLMTNQVWHDDPRRLGFVLARYKFCSKMLAGKKRVLEVGCADAFGTRVVQQEVPQVVVIDFDPVFIADVQARMSDRWPLECRVHDMLSGPVEGRFDGAYSLDVLEHIDPAREQDFMRNIAASLEPTGVLIVGSPSIHSQAYASPPSRAGHINCKDHRQLRELMERFFENVFIFSMNDEVVHTGYYAMAHYYFALCCGNKASAFAR
jgi:2-polyprenyl-3-methyl-5-hydroxy-6-metoxy-1,4-benzoquinol methylase